MWFPLQTERLYYTDATLQRFTARVLECRATEGGYAVILDRTAFYPTSGGQPHDTGRLGGRQVVEVTEDEATGLVLHRVDGPLAGEVEGEIDWARRLDHMEQHTGQHLLSRVFEVLYDADTIGFHLGAEATTIDLELESLTADQVEAAENLANQVLREDRPVLTHWAPSPEEALERFPLRKPPAVAGTVRVIEIGGFDFSACGGTHVASTGRLGLIKIKAWERYKKGVRLTFLVGGRAMADYQRLDRMTRDLARSLSLGVWELPVAVDRFRDEAGRLRKQLKEAREQLLEVEARELLAGARLVAGVRVVTMAFGGRPLDEVKALATKVAAHPRAVALFGTRGALPQLVFARSVDVRVDMGAVLRQVLPAIEGKGGGSPLAAQGAGKKPEGLQTALEVALARVNDGLRQM